MKIKTHYSVPVRLRNFATLLMSDKKVRNEYTQQTIAQQDECIKRTVVNSDGEREVRRIRRDYIQLCNLVTSSNRQNINNGDYQDQYGVIHCGKCNKAKEMLYTSVEMCNGEDVMLIKWRPLACDCELTREADHIASTTRHNIEDK